MPRTTPSDVRDELGVDSTEYPDNDADTDIKRAHWIVDDRIADRLDDTPENEERMTSIETLVAAHLASEEFTDGVQNGRSISSITQGTAQLSFQDDDVALGPGGFASTYWGEALTLDPTGRLGVQTRGVNVISTDMGGP